MENKVKLRGVAGCELLRGVESVDPRAAEGLGREKPTAVAPDVDFLLEEETRRSITDPYQKLLFEVKVLHRKGNFKTSQGNVIVQRVRDVAAGGKAELDLSRFLISKEFVDLLIPYLRSKTCKLTALNLSGTSIGVEAAVDIARATNNTLLKLQFSDNPIPAGILRVQVNESGEAILSGLNFNHLDAAAIGILVERERKHLHKLDLSGSLLTGPKSNVFQGITILFECLKKCRHLRELNIRNTNLRSDGLVAFANAIQDFPVLEKLDLSWYTIAPMRSVFLVSNRCAMRCGGLKHSVSSEFFSLAGNYLDYESSVYIAEMLNVNCTILTLALSQNPLGDAGAVDVSSALKKNVTLLTLNLSDCQISCEGVTEVATVLRKFNSTLRTLNILDNPDVRSQGYRSLVKCTSVNHKVTEVLMDPGTRYAKYVTKVKDFLVVNELLTTVQTSPKRFAGFPLLSETQRTNFVDKLERSSDSELLQLHEARVLENAVDEKEAAGLSTLRHYAASEQYAPLKRLLWCFEVETRHKTIIERSSSKKEANNDEDDEDIWDYPLV